jgi:2,3-dihydroxybenzoate decarboxylase
VKIIALEESFWYEELATEGSTVSHVHVKTAVAADWQRKLVDFTEYRLPDMDRNDVDVQVRDTRRWIPRCGVGPHVPAAMRCG